ncbi:unnamed protein product [Orchesella dallaii]|uniref:Uncharacterized protein n=1 Tax=Orchesella dallaii TaxID=48710 RepID=A0ABP1RVC9_9HEXA
MYSQQNQDGNYPPPPQGFQTQPQFGATYPPILPIESSGEAPSNPHPTHLIVTKDGRSYKVEILATGASPSQFSIVGGAQPQQMSYWNESGGGEAGAQGATENDGLPQHERTSTCATCWFWVKCCGGTIGVIAIVLLFIAAKIFKKWSRMERRKEEAENGYSG